MIARKIAGALVAVVAFAMMPVANALNVNVAVAGSLAEVVGSQTDATTLAVDGDLNAADLAFIAEKMPQLVSLDLRNARIVAYDGDLLYTGLSVAPANALPQFALASTGISSVVLPATLKTIGDAAFSGMKLKSVTLPEGLVAIGAAAFAECSELESINIPASVAEVGARAFKGCSSLKSATIAGSLQQVAPQTFMGCASLSTVILPATIESIGAEAFSGCSSLASLQMPEKLRSIGSMAFARCGLENLSLAGCESLTEIGAWAFVNNDKLATVVFSPATATMGEGCFYNDASLALTALPEALEVIPDYAFNGSATTESTVLGDNVTDIGAYSLGNWKSIATLELPSGVAYIGDGAMENMTSLKKLVVTDLAMIPELGEDVWQGVDQAQTILYVHSEMADQFREAAQWKEFNIMVDPTTSESDVVLPGAENAVEARLSGDMLHLYSQVPMLSVQLFDLTGRSYSQPVGVPAEQFSCNTAAIGGPVLIVKVMLEGVDRPVVLKLSR